MATATARVTFGSVLRFPGVAGPFAASLLGRLPMGAVGLVLILRTRELTGSFAVGGLAAGVFALLNGLSGPALGRLVDARGQTGVLLGGALLNAAALLVFAALPGGTGSAPVLLLAALIGAAQPPLGSCLRVLWADMVRDPGVRHAVYALESAVLEGVYIAGPVLIVGGIGAISTPAAVVACAFFGLAGTLVFALTSASRAWRPSGTRAAGRAGALADRRILLLLGILTFVALSFAIIEIAVPALCEREGSVRAAGMVLGIWGLGSLTGGVVSGRTSAPSNPERRFAWMLAALALGTLPLVLASGIVSLAGLVFLAGLAIAPSLAGAMGLVGQIAPAGTVTEAFTWVGTAMGTGFAIGGALGGAIVQGSGASAGFAAAAGAAAGAALLARGARAALRPA
jgi:predicted MFS family arabinose efflux permease